MADSESQRPWRETFDQLRAVVKDWYEAEAQALAARYEQAGDPEHLDFSELTRRSQALLACEMIELIGEPGPEPASAEDAAQLERVAQAMRARGKEVPESIRKLLEE